MSRHHSNHGVMVCPPNHMLHQVLDVHIGLPWAKLDEVRPGKVETGDKSAKTMNNSVLPNLA